MQDPKNPYGPHTQRWQDRNRKYEAAQQAENRRYQQTLDSLSRSGTNSTGGTYVGGRAGGGSDMAVGLFVLAGLGGAFYWLYTALGSYWLAGVVLAAGIGGLIGLYFGLRSFFSTELGRTIGRVLAIGAAIAALGGVFWVSYATAGTVGLSWAGVVVGGLVGIIAAFFLLKRAVRYKAGKIAIALAIVGGVVYLILLVLP